MNYNRKIHFSYRAYYISITFFILISITLSCVAAQSKAANKGLVVPEFTIPFNLAQPDTLVVLDKKLYEISGISISDNNELYAINDEKGKLYLLSRETGKIIDDFNFAKNDDYEGVTIAGSYAYIVESNGNIKKVDLIKKDKVDEYENFLSKRNDVEGICYVENENVILLACKDELENEKDEFDRGIYAFDLSTESLREKPYFVLNILKIASELTLSNLPDNDLVKLGMKNRMKSFGPSAIGIDPCTGLVYILSSRGGLLVVAEKDGTINGIFFLKPLLFGQPEGLTFDNVGNLYISNEARSRKANLLFFRRTY